MDILQRSIVVIAHNLRSVHNVGSLLRTGEVFAIDTVYVTGFTPYPAHPGDERDPKLRDRQTRQLAKAAAGAERTMPFERHPDLVALLSSLRDKGYTVAGLEIDPDAVTLTEYTPPPKVALLLGDEVAGITPALREQCDLLLRISTYGRKDTLNVSVAAGIALHALRTREGSAG
ncbi:tRNA G18 (ribose-2'-O)-methylase SpoU [Lipingzhangella halophila]|uniref:tRNA G18 (Ribose-2'-O)-methylase SpoU n=1 Tax=Lipingzhangella halophila TaxID=1783352 RepID=A0A7W7W5E9_9ACTN|nr:TrmH family RNA methyltransferase [Lipingzhangella halophila]MBB4933779.1 tRNA G18 (ribose-2'-O)-methylase SpoU [Lipingzhangella halophila]